MPQCMWNWKCFNAVYTHNHKPWLVQESRIFGELMFRHLFTADSQNGVGTNPTVKGSMKWFVYISKYCKTSWNKV